MKRKVSVSALALLGALAVACGDDSDDGNGGGGGGEEIQKELTLVPITADNADAPIRTPHVVSLLNAETGEPIDSTTWMTDGNGKVTLPLLRDQLYNVYVQGVGPAGGMTSTYDTVVLNVNPDSGDTLLRISSAGTLSLAEGSGGFTAKADRAAVTGAVYWSPDNVRKGAIGCVKLFIDGATELSTEFDQRYMANTPLPARPEVQDQTSRRGQFYIANMTTGVHTISAKIGDREIANVEFFIPFTRAEAKSETKSMLMQLGIDVDVAENPTPAECPQLM